MHFGDADTGPHIGRLDKAGKSQRLLDPGGNLVGPIAPILARDESPGQLRQPGLLENGFRDCLVHSDGRTEDTRPHEWHTCHLQQALKGAVFAHWSVQRREKDIDGLGYAQRNTGSSRRSRSVDQSKRRILIQ
jgi:hypothetical protein